MDRKRRKLYLREPALGIPRKTLTRHRQSTPLIDSSFSAFSDTDEDHSAEMFTSFSTEISSSDFESDDGADVQFVGAVHDDMDDDDDDDDDVSTSFFAEEEEEPSTNYDSLLYEGAPAGLTEYLGHLLVFQYSVKHSLTSKALEDLLKLLSVFLPDKASLAKSTHGLKKFFLKKYKAQQPVFHPYCISCHKALQHQEPCDCGGRTSSFLSVPIAPQLKARLENPQVLTAIQSRQVTSTEVMKDIDGGRLYKKMKDFTSKGNLTLFANTDGVQLFKSSTVSMWPIWFIINELPLSLRFSKKNMILGGLWFDSEKPTMNLFMKPLIESANELYFNGIQVTLPNGSTVVKAAVVGLTCDLPARAQVLNMKLFNGQFGCHLCEDEGVTSEATPMLRWWPQNQQQKLRSKESMLENYFQTKNGETIKGIKSASILTLHPPLDICRGVVVDSLHCIYLGVMRKMIVLWFGVKNRGKDYSIRSKIDLCDKRLLNIKVPDRISRTPASIADIKRWKGSELKSWLLYYSLPVLRGVLPTTYYNHYSLLVASIHILASECIKQEDLDNCERWLKEFYEKFEELYGIENCTMNVHLLSHLTECVRDWGPLWAYSCFSFESANHTLSKLFHGSKNMTEQMAFTYVVTQVLPSDFPDNPSTKVQHLTNILLGHKSYNKKFLKPSFWSMGKIESKKLTAEEREVIWRYYGEEVDPFTFKRLQRGGEVFHSELYTCVQRRNTYTISYSQGNFGLIKFYTLHKNKPAAVLQKIDILPYTHFRLHINIVPVQVTTQLIVIPLEHIEDKCIFIELDDNNLYIAKFTCSLILD